MMIDNPPSAGSFRYKIGTTLLVSGLAAGTRKTDIQGAFGDFGQIMRIDLEAGDAYVEFEDERDALDAMKDMNGVKLKGRALKVERTRTKQKAPRYFGSSPQEARRRERRTEHRSQPA
eukprot:CAMPEP_0194547294 /NCGR_PEP_ID=MMETSP0253-20130528/91947_1 /TAXON_ID=2966 /ORGANISM="Noctiluca scintillans" /LENGTH=117 /DNA_ID=CAMNT_0039394485 /DNA_START=36 /DNA_END=385 /DNA_ORIENTATION=+